MAQPALTVAHVNTDLATLTGAEADLAYDCNDWLTSFATLSYVEGRDRTRGNRGLPIGSSGPQEPLPGIVPLESCIGLRVHDPHEQPRWAAEFGARILAEQNRVPSSLLEQPTPGFAIFDLRGYWQATDSLMLIAGVENRTDKHYREHLNLRTGYGVYQPGRSFYFGTELQY